MIAAPYSLGRISLSNLPELILRFVHGSTGAPVRDVGDDRELEGGMEGK